MVFDGVVASRRRERELASDVRAGSWARSRARVAQRVFWRRNWRVVVAFAAIVLVPGALASWLIPSPFVGGVILGVALATVPGVIWPWTVLVTGTGPVMMGDQAERWTAHELRTLRGHGWQLVNHFLLRRDDVDHVLIGPGGVWAVETKWSSSWESPFAQERLRSAADQARSSARSMSLWTPMRTRGLKVRPVVVLWGGGLRDLDPAERVRWVDDVPVVVGTSLAAWVRALPGDLLDGDTVASAYEAVDDQTRVRDVIDQELHPVPLSFDEFLLRAGVAGTSLAVACWASLQAWLHAPSPWWLAGVHLVALAPLARLPRTGWLRDVIWGWLGGVTLTLALVAVLYARATLR